MRPISLICTLLVLSGVAPAQAVTHLRRGDRPPPIKLNNLEDQPFSLDAEKGRAVVVVFGELYHARTLEACRTLAAILSDPRVAEIRPDCVLIAAQQVQRDALRAAASEQGVTIPVLHDRDRVAFAAYQVSVLPSFVVIDRAGLVTYACAGLLPSFRDVVTDAILLAGGKLSAAQFDRTLNPSSAPAESESSRRAGRLTELARQLARTGMYDLAAEKYREAIAQEPRLVAARVGLGRMWLERRRLPEAEEQFRAALAVDATSVESQIGLVYVQVLRGGSELPKAEQQVRSLLTQRPNDAEAHYLLGLIHEQSGRSKEAAASFRKAAELLLEQGGQSVRENRR